MCWAGLGSRFCRWDLAPRTGVDVGGVRAGVAMGAGGHEPAMSCLPWEPPAVSLILHGRMSARGVMFHSLQATCYPHTLTLLPVVCVLD